MRNNKAFTALELILALLLMSIVLMTIYSAYFQFMYAQDKTASMAQRFMDITNGVALVTRDLTNVVHFDFSLSYPNELGFVGDSKSMRFFIKEDQDIQAVAYEVKSLKKIYDSSSDKIFKRFLEYAYADQLDQNHVVVVRKSSRYQAYFQEKKWDKERILFPPFLDHKDIRWDFKAQKDNGITAWQGSWVNLEAPGAMRLTFNANNQGEKPDNITIIWPVGE